MIYQIVSSMFTKMSCILLFRNSIDSTYGLKSLLFCSDKKLTESSSPITASSIFSFSSDSDSFLLFDSGDFWVSNCSSTSGSIISRESPSEEEITRAESGDSSALTWVALVLRMWVFSSDQTQTQSPGASRESDSHLIAVSIKPGGPTLNALKTELIWQKYAVCPTLSELGA